MPTLYERTCNQCKQQYKGRGKKFCSNSCRVTWTNIHRNVAKRSAVRKKLSRIAKEGNYQANMMTNDARKKANKSISRALTGRKLSKEHKRAISDGCKRAGCMPPKNIRLTGNKHPQWKGGHSKLRPREYRKKIYLDFRKAVLERDNFACQDWCKKGNRLEVHHIKAWGSHPKLRYEASNGIVVCRKCHLSRHRGVPRPITTGPRVVSDLL